MIPFVLIAAAMIAVALACVLVPLLRGAKPQGIARVKWTVVNQSGEAVYTFTPIAIVPRRPSAT